MAYFAKINNGIVEQVIAIEKDVLDTGLFGDPSEFVQTSYNTKGGVHYDPTTGQPSADQSKALRKNYAGIGYIYDTLRDAFYSPQPYPSWTLNEQTCYWTPPYPAPEDGFYVWNELNQTWEKQIV
jgi:hypothetical protein